VDTYLAVASKRDWRSYADRPIEPAVVDRILDAGRVSGSAVNRQPWTFVVVEDEGTKDALAATVYAAANVQTAALVVAIATPGGGNAIDVGRAMQNMMLVAWSDGVASCPNGMPDAQEAARVLGLQADLQPVTVLTFGYPKRTADVTAKPPESWSAEANRKPLSELVKRV
jgi:nitroreductase